MNVLDIEGLVNGVSFDTLGVPVTYNRIQGGTVTTRVQVYRRSRKLPDARSYKQPVNRFELLTMASIPRADVEYPDRDDTFTYGGQKYSVESVDNSSQTRHEVVLRMVDC